MHITPATTQDYPHIDALLTAAAMVPAIYAAPSRWWVARDAQRNVKAAIGVEPGPSAWLLRSCVVAADARQHGLGKALLSTVTTTAQDAGIATLLCFGTDVGDYWALRGFHRISVEELCALVPTAPQIQQFTANGWLADEWAWRKDL